MWAVAVPAARTDGRRRSARSRAPDRDGRCWPAPPGGRRDSTAVVVLVEHDLVSSEVLGPVVVAMVAAVVVAGYRPERQPLAASNSPARSYSAAAAVVREIALDHQALRRPRRPARPAPRAGTTTGWAEAASADRWRRAPGRSRSRRCACRTRWRSGPGTGRAERAVCAASSPDGRRSSPRRTVSSSSPSSTTAPTPSRTLTSADLAPTDTALSPSCSERTTSWTADGSTAKTSTLGSAVLLTLRSGWPASTPPVPAARR